MYESFSFKGTRLYIGDSCKKENIQPYIFFYRVTCKTQFTQSPTHRFIDLLEAYWMVIIARYNVSFRGYTSDQK